jgi:hypothetical protein
VKEFKPAEFLLPAGFRISRLNLSVAFSIGAGADDYWQLGTGYNLRA